MSKFYSNLYIPVGESPERSQLERYTCFVPEGTKCSCTERQQKCKEEESKKREEIELSAFTQTSYATVHLNGPTQNAFSAPLISTDKPEIETVTQKNLKTKLKAKKIIEKELGDEDLREIIKELTETDTEFAKKIIRKFKELKAVKKPKLFSTTGGERNWNEEFQKLVERNVIELQDTSLCKEAYLLVGDFYHAASIYAQIIISELCLTYEQKTIKPVSIGGIAGGAKYIIGGILFKFAVDQRVSDDPVMYMYGGETPRDDLAMKAASRELQAVCTMFSTSPRNLRFPLMAIVDYLGYRVIASSLLPINDTTIKYGSNDGGLSVKYEIDELNQSMAKALDFWNLGPHEVGIEGHPICGPGDIEGHLGTDGRYYVIDMARMTPPEAPPLLKEERMKDPRGVFYKLLRIELLIESTEKYSSDSFTGWSRFDKNRLENERKIRRLTTYLHQSVIPHFAKSFEDIQFLSPYASSNVNANTNNTFFGVHRTDLHQYSSNELFKFLDRIDLTFLMHFVGINMRHLGKLRSHLKSNIHRQLLLCHIAARAIKNRIREKMRNEMKNLFGSPSDIPFRELLIQQFNLILGREQSSDEYWMSIKADMATSFVDCFSDEELKDYDIRKSLDLRVVIYLLQKLTSVNINPRALNSMYEQIHSFEMVASDIINTSPSVKQMHISSMCSAVLLRRNSQVQDREAKFRLLLAAKADVERTLRVTPKCPHVAKLYSLTLLDLLSVDENMDNREVYLNTLITQLVVALNFIPCTTYSVALEALKIIDQFPRKSRLHEVSVLVNRVNEIKKVYGYEIEEKSNLLDSIDVSKCKEAKEAHHKMKSKLSFLLNETIINSDLNPTDNLSNFKAQIELPTSNASYGDQISTSGFEIEAYIDQAPAYIV